MVDQNFNKQAWDHMVSKFNAEFGPQHDEDVLKSRFFNLRKRFHDMKFLLDQDGFVWDELQQMIIAEDDLWDTYIEEYPHARSYQNRALPNFNDLFLIFGNSYTSNHEHCLFDSVDANDSYPEVNIVDEEEEQFFSDNSDQAIIEWTNQMDDYYVDLMLEQVRRGNKIGSTFTDHAWAWMVASFNKTFELTCDRDLLESRFFSIKKEYKDAQHMLVLRSLQMIVYAEAESSIENVVSALQSVPDMDDELFLEACKLLEDERKAKVFVTMDVTTRKRWLSKKLCG
ncbi:L10-interacting MYB domain-containing protein, partial [Cucurbita argyrosperma subsp. sororia]